MKPRVTVAFVAVAFVVGALALAAVLCIEDPFLTNDGPSHAYGRFVHDHVDDPSYGFAPWLAPSSPWTSRGFDEIFSVVDRVAGFRVALQATTIVTAELWAFAFVAVVVALDKRRALLGVLGFAFALQTPLYIGLYPSMLATALGLFAIALWIRHGTRGVVDHVVVAALLLVAAFCHVVAAALAGLVVVAVTAAEPGSWRTRVVRLALVAVVGAPAAAIALLAQDASVAADTPSLVFDDVIERVLFVERAFQPPGVVRPLAALFLCVAGVVLCARTQRDARAPERGLLAAGVVLVLLAMAMPENFKGWQLVRERFVPLGTALLAALIPLERLGQRTRIAATSLAAVYVAGSLAWGASVNAAVAKNASGALAGLSRVQKEPRDWLPIILDVTAGGDHGIEHFEPLIHLGDLYGMALGGVVEYSQTRLPSLHLAVHTRQPPGSVPPQEIWNEIGASTGPERAARLRWLLELASTREGIILWGTPPDVAVAKDAGFVSSFDEGGLFIGRFVGCDGSVVVDGITGPPAVDVDVGWWPDHTSSATFSLVGSGHDETKLARFGCGEVWLHVAGHRCREADPALGVDGPVRAHFSAGDTAHNVLHCTATE